MHFIKGELRICMMLMSILGMFPAGILIGVQGRLLVQHDFGGVFGAAF